jgi:transposase
LYRAERETELRTRWHALWLLRKGSSLQETAQVVGVHLRTLFKGLSWYRQGGIEAIRQHRQGNRKGRPPFLTPEQCAQLRERAADGGFTSLEEARQWVEQTFCVRYTLWGIRSLFQRLKITRKMPRPRAAQASPEVQQAWKKGAWKPL